MSKRVFLHVGLPKSGTTYLQAVLATNKERLMAEASLLFPGETWKDQVRAVRDVRQMPLRTKRQRQTTPGAWDALVQEIRAWPGDAVISMEWLCRADPGQVRRIVDDLAPARVEVIFTVRDLARTIPASWQESVQNQEEWSWPDFLQLISKEDPEVPRPDRRFWKLHDAVALVGRWTPFLPSDQVHVVTVPQAGAPPTLLWDRFSGVMGLDGSGFVAQGVTANESLGIASTELLRRLNPRLRQAGVSLETRSSMVTKQLAKRGLSSRKFQEPRLTLPADVHDWVRECSEQEIQGLAAAGVHLVGDLEELRPDLSAPVAVQPQELDPAVLLDTALDALVISVQQRQNATAAQDAVIAERDTEIRKLLRRIERLKRRRAKAATRVKAWRAHPLRAALGIHARRHRLGRAVLARVRRHR